MKKYVKVILIILISICFTYGCCASRMDTNIRSGKKSSKNANLLTVRIRGKLLDLYNDLDEEYVSQKISKNEEEWLEFKEDFYTEIKELEKMKKSEDYTNAEKKIEELLKAYEEELNGNKDKVKITELKKDIISLLKN